MKTEMYLREIFLSTSPTAKAPYVMRTGMSIAVNWWQVSLMDMEFLPFFLGSHTKVRGCNVNLGKKEGIETFRLLWFFR